MAEVLFKTQFWLDDTGGTLTDYSADIQSLTGPDGAKALITPTGINHSNEQAQNNAQKSYTIGLTGWYQDTSVGLWNTLATYWDTSVEASKTFQVGRGTLGKPYQYGECVLESLTPPPADNVGTGLLFSASLRVDNGVTRTSVSQA